MNVLVHGDTKMQCKLIVPVGRRRAGVVLGGLMPRDTMRWARRLWRRALIVHGSSSGRWRLGPNAQRDLFVKRAESLDLRLDFLEPLHEFAVLGLDGDDVVCSWFE